MKKMKLFVVAVLMFCFFTSGHAWVFADEELSLAVPAEIRAGAVEIFEEGYSWAYDFISDSVILCERNVENGVTEDILFLEMTVMLKADSVEQLDYYKGVSEYFAIATDTSVSRDNSIKNLMTSQEFQLYSQAVTAEKNNIYANLDKYIGEEQVLNCCVKVQYAGSNYESAEYLIEDGLDYVEPEVYFAAGASALRQSGYEYMAYQSEKISTKVIAGARSQSAVYDIGDAVFYAEDYSSNPTSCNLHSSCGNKVNTALYNPAYTHYADIHSDCANFMSQALYAAGIPTDSTWYPESTAWINVARLSSHMLEKGYWEEITSDALWVGDYMRYTGSSSHIVLITAFDGVSYRYTAHTNDRKNYATSLNSSSRKYYHVIY